MGIKIEILKKYVNKNFIETGSFKGDGIETALRSGFKNIYSIEVDPVWYGRCKKRFIGKDNIYLYLGDSPAVLPEILKKIQEPSTFWLDAHPNGVSSGSGRVKCPILGEIALVLGHNTSHTLLIDDREFFAGNGIDYWGNVNESQIMEEIKKYSDKVTVSYEDGRKKNNVIVIREKK